MAKKVAVVIIVMILFALLTSCKKEDDKGHLQKVGILVPETINDQVWGTKGYSGMLRIQNRFGVDVYYKEWMNSKVLTEKAVEEFSHKGVNLIFGHGSEYAEDFNQIASKFPNIHFVSFNGNAKCKNTTSLKFEGYAMGFFGGMTAAHETKTKKIAVLATYKWQPEIKGFVDGAKYENPDVQVFKQYVGNWDDTDQALHLLDGLIDKGADVVYPAGDRYSVPVIQKLKEKRLYAIGYVSDQSDLGKYTVLTSTVQHVDKLYEVAAARFAEGKLPPGNLYFDFQDGVITMGKWSPVVDKPFRERLNRDIAIYTKTGKLPSKSDKGGI
ncbi:BMP family ABC transporter substrate-binding protein [Bacillus smithii]|uniref:BMP family ABC transporter substrate-binding protein n=1 Tax=Bacillus smithii TaxID=1479 RepID=UPI00065E0E64|nr:BMP family ABC transporter substrate-binding protein [Bacillus smithii]AKP46370.1 positive regulator of comK [Bacillus smithii]MED0660732.1 BMP family ABC transporter substrate-binding protein [Bacillus smithii]MED4884796.1 BMP family ABC transporter substrate-binding protein [Bacillus smithii]MED4926777.1 BMP family ABC transporter substrate-binding protein [Bacillus smithii]